MKGEYNMYEIIDESLKIAACGINDLTLDQAQHFLSLWEDGAKLGTLTLFFNPDTGYLVLNKDHSQYEFNLKLARVYLAAGEKELEKYRERFGGRLEETLRVMDNFREYSRARSDLNMIEHQCIGEVIGDPVIRGVLEALGGKDVRSHFLMSEAYAYGVINGKRAERARRKAVMI